jgi:hypothetical protein
MIKRFAALSPAGGVHVPVPDVKEMTQSLPTNALDAVRVSVTLTVRHAESGGAAWEALIEVE